MSELAKICFRYSKSNWWMKFDEQMLELFKSDLQVILALNHNKHIPAIDELSQTFSVSAPEQIIQNLIIYILNILNHFYQLQMALQFNASASTPLRQYSKFLQFIYTVNNLEIIYCRECWANDWQLPNRLKSTLLRFIDVFQSIKSFDFSELPDEKITQNWLFMIKSIELQFSLFLNKVSPFQKTHMQEYFLINISNQKLSALYKSISAVSQLQKESTKELLIQKITQEQQTLQIQKIVLTIKEEILKDNKILSHRLQQADKQKQQTPPKAKTTEFIQPGAIRHQSREAKSRERQNFQYQTFEQYYRNNSSQKKKETEQQPQTEPGNPSAGKKPQALTLYTSNPELAEELSEKIFVGDVLSKPPVSRDKVRSLHSSQVNLQTHAREATEERQAHTSLTSRTSSAAGRKDFHKMEKLIKGMGNSSPSRISQKQDARNKSIPKVSSMGNSLDIEVDQKRFSTVYRSIKNSSQEHKKINPQFYSTSKYPKSFSKIIQKLQLQSGEKPYQRSEIAVKEEQMQPRNYHFSFGAQFSRESSQAITRGEASERKFQEQQGAARTEAHLSHSKQEKVTEIDDNLMKEILDYDINNESRPDDASKQLQHFFTFSDDEKDPRAQN